MLVIRDYGRKDIATIVLLKSRLTRLHTAIDAGYYAPSADADAVFKKYLTKRAGDADFKVLMAMDDARCIGYVMGWIEERPPIYRKRRVGYLSNIFVDETRRKQDIGVRLYRALDRWFREKQVDFIEIRADARNQAALRSFKKYGLKELSVTFYKAAGTKKRT